MIWRATVYQIPLAYGLGIAALVRCCRVVFGGARSEAESSREILFLV